MSVVKSSTIEICPKPPAIFSRHVRSKSSVIESRSDASNNASSYHASRLLEPPAPSSPSHSPLRQALARRPSPPPSHSPSPPHRRLSLFPIAEAAAPKPERPSFDLFPTTGMQGAVPLTHDDGGGGQPEERGSRIRRARTLRHDAIQCPEIATYGTMQDEHADDRIIVHSVTLALSMLYPTDPLRIFDS